MTPSSTERRLPYIGALDGLRALAVLAVLLYHLDTPWGPLSLAGGYFGVDIFFVLSGYLITSLLFAEYQRRGAVGLQSFWLRRARRLLPAVLFLLAAALGYSLIFLTDEVASLRGDALASFGYVTNWYLIFHNESYFESWGRPSLFQHLWSLAIEEQFYVVWPVVFVAGMRLLRPRGMLIATLAAAIGSTALMAVLYEPGVDPSRVYYGTDTRSAGLLIGSALALVAPLSSVTGDVTSSRLRDCAGMLGLALLAYFVTAIDDASTLPYYGGFTLVALATAAVIASVVRGRSSLAPLLGAAPLRLIGTRSYSIYLWHWPVLMLTRPELDVPFTGWPLVVVQIAVVCTLAELSYRLVETPIRTGALLRLFGRMRQELGTRAYWPTAAAGSLSLVLILIMGVMIWRVDVPAALSSSSSIGIDGALVAAPMAGLAEDGALEGEKAPGTTTPHRTKTPVLGSLHCTIGDLSTAAAVCGTPTPTVPAATATPTLPLPARPARITAIGDSVMLGAAAQLSVALETDGVHAKVGLQASEGRDLLRYLRGTGALGEVVVIHLGNNGEFNARQLEEMMDELREVPLVIFINLKVPRDWQTNNNHMLEEAIGRYANARLIDWHAQSENQPQYFWNDGLHLRLEGALVYSAVILEEIRASWPEAAALGR